MEWPKDVLDTFDKGLGVVPRPGMSKVEVLCALLDEAARRAVWRAAGNPAYASAALHTPYTPLGSVINESINGLARRLTLDGPLWGEAVNAFHAYVENNAEEVFAAFAGEGRPYHHDMGFGPIAPAGTGSSGEAEGE